MESQFVVVRLVPSHLLMLVVLTGSSGLSKVGVAFWRLSVDRLAILDKYELSFWTLLEGAPGELLRLPGMLLDKLPLERWSLTWCAVILDSSHELSHSSNVTSMPHLDDHKSRLRRSNSAGCQILGTNGQGVGEYERLCTVNFSASQEEVGPA